MNDNLIYGMMVLFGIMLIFLQGGMILAPILKGIWIFNYMGLFGLIMVVVGVFILSTRENASMLKGVDESEQESQA